ALAELVRTRQVHPRELVERSLERIAALDPHLNAFRTTLAEQALAQADAAHGSQGPLAGVPIAIKDDLPVAGESITRGSRSYGPPQAADAEAVRRLRAAGAIPIGITRVPELMIFPWTASAAGGVTRNPWDPSRTPGGSSGGSAAAVASGMVPAATGSDGGGSIRIPAACCGLVGMKPTRGRVSAMPLGQGWLGLSVYGALARTVADSALMLDAMHGAIAGERDAAPAYSGRYVEAAARAPERLRIAISRKVPPGLIVRLSSEQRAAWEGTAGLLADLGHDVQERDPSYGLAQLDFLRMWVRGIHEQSLTVPDRSQLEPSTRQMASAGRYLTPDRRRQQLLAGAQARARRIMALWEQFDVLLTPGLARTAIAAEGGYGKSAPVAVNIAGRSTPYTPLFNLTGQPAVSIPAGFGAGGLPLSVQLVGRPGAEDTLYSLAGQIESARPWAHARPPLS
ncbi:MAG: amidase, partial [Solirubrobacterales bacterium]|nr:amidase [Solirubrobacterales bacterium]